MRRRTAWFALAAAAGGLAAGAGAWWHTESRSPSTSTLPGSGVWSARFATLDGAPLDMRSLLGRPLVLNFWATWCPPCVVELPLLDAFHARHREAGWQVLALAVDEAEAVGRFVASHGLRLPVAVAGVAGLELARTLGNTQGGLPFTVLFDRAGEVRRQHLGVVTAELLDEWRDEIDKTQKKSATRRHSHESA